MEGSHTTAMPTAECTCSILDLIGAVVGTFLATSVTVALVTMACVIYGKKRNSEFQASGMRRETIATEAQKVAIAAKSSSQSSNKQQDDKVFEVFLHGRPFEGLGFDVIGNMTDGLFVSRVLNRGPAYESGCIRPGDRVDELTISTRNMVFEDALTILSYASSYPVILRLRRCPSTGADENGSDHRRISHLSADTPRPIINSTPVGSARLTRLSAAPNRQTLTAPAVMMPPSTGSRSVFRSQSASRLSSRMTSAADACGGADVFGDGTIDDTNRVRVVKSTTALDEAASVEFQLIQRQIEILENSEARTVQRPLHRQRRRKNEIGGLHPGALYPRSSRTDSERCHRYRHDDRQVASDDSRSSKDELNTAHDESHFFRCSQTSEDFDDEDSESTVRKQPVITAADNVRAATAAEGAAASAAAHVRKKKAAKSRAREEHQQDGSFGSAMRSGEDDGVNCEWLPSKTWKYFRRSSIDDNHFDDDDDDDNDERKISRVVAECNSKRRRRRRWGFIVGDVSSTASTVVVTSATSSSEYDDAVEQRFGAGVGSGSMSSSLHCAVDSESDAKTMSTLSLQSASRWSAEHGGGDRSLTKAGGSLVRSGGFDNLHEACILHPAEPDQWSVQRVAMTSDADTEFGRTCAEAEWSPPLANSGNFAAGDNDANDVELSSFDLIKDLNRAVAVTDGKWIVGEPDESAVDTTMEYGCPSGDESWSERRRSWPV